VTEMHSPVSQRPGSPARGRTGCQKLQGSRCAFCSSTLGALQSAFNSALTMFAPLARLSTHGEALSLSIDVINKIYSRNHDLMVETPSSLSASNSQVQKYEQIKRNIEDNLNYRAANEEELRLTAEIDELQQKVVALGDETGMSEDMERGRQDRDTMNDEVRPGSI
jgi:hypothetical protein